MRLKEKPSKPVRKKNVQQNIDIEDYSIEALLDLIPEGVDYGNVYIVQDCDYYSDYCDDVLMRWYEDESDEAFNKRLEKYEKKLADYNEWYTENKDDIEATLKERADKKARAKQKQIEKLEQQLKKLKK